MINVPTNREVNFVLRKRVKLRALHSRIFRKFNDIRGYNGDNKDMVMKEFIAWCGKEFNMTPFECHMYWNYLMSRADLKSKVFIDMTDMLEKEGFIDKNDSLKFINRFDGIRWILAFRHSKIAFTYNLGNKYGNSC